mgnify:CR=1 FL=1
MKCEIDKDKENDVKQICDILQIPFLHMIIKTTL